MDPAPQSAQSPNAGAAPPPAADAAAAECDTLRARLQCLERRFERLAAVVSDYVFSVTIAKGRVIRTVHAPGCLRVTGYRPEEFAADPLLWLRMVPEADQAAVVAQAQAILQHGDAAPLEHRIVHKDGRVRWVRNTPVLCHGADGSLSGYDGLVRDFTEAKQAELDREALIAELQGALARVNALSGLLPICAGCKSIRNDRGYWEQVEQYIEQHSDAHFSHGLCPECVVRLYPDYAPGGGTPGAAPPR
jgi:PAS domain S-box-containing protein